MASSLLIAELKKRGGLRKSLFPEQRKAVEDASKRKAYCCTRRAGKTTAIIVGDFVLDALNHPNAQYAFIALTRPSAEGIAWPIIQQINREYRLGAHLRSAKLQATFPNGSSISLYGADRPGWMQRMYGYKLRGVAIDEAAFYQIDLGEFIDDILEAAISDLGGFIVLASTPGYVPRGLFYEVTEKSLPGWSVHRWTALDNPYMEKQFRAKIKELRDANPQVDTTPSFRRNFLGEWATERSERVYVVDPKRNVIPSYKRKPTDRYVLGIDLGWHDATAFAVMCYGDHMQEVVCIEAHTEKEMLLDKVASYVRMYMDQYEGIVVFGDPSKRQAFEELRRRYGLPIRAADRTDKRSYIELINADLRNGVYKIVGQDNPLIKEMTDLVWKTRPNRERIEHPAQPNDVCDAALYAYRYTYQFRYEEITAPPKAGTKQYWDEEANKIEKALLLEHERELALRGRYH